MKYIFRHYLGLSMSTLSASAVFGVKAPSSQSLTRLRTEQKLGLGDLDLALGPPLSRTFFVIFLVAKPSCNNIVSQSNAMATINFSDFLGVLSSLN